MRRRCPSRTPAAPNDMQCEGKLGHDNGHWFGLHDPWHDRICCGRARPIETKLKETLTAIAVEDAVRGYPRRFPLVLHALDLASALHLRCGLGWDDKPTAVVGYRAVAYIELPTGQVSWHMPEFPAEWDGHSDEVKEERSRAYRETGWES